ncbi:MAG: hypothetical protein ACKOX6_02855 [Bdellovibrio sp.]
MLNCPLCKNQVEELSPSTPVLPAWMYHHIGDSEPPHQVTVCKKCALRFSREAAFSEEFFKNKAYLRKAEAVFDDGVTGIEYFHGSGKTGLLYLLVGLILKQHILEAQQGQDLLGPAFERLAKDYLGRCLEEENYSLLVFKLLAMEYCLEHPQKNHFEKLNAIETLILGYQFILLTDQRELPESSAFFKISKQKELIVIVDDESSDPSFKNIRKFAKTRT